MTRSNRGRIQLHHELVLETWIIESEDVVAVAIAALGDK